MAPSTRRPLPLWFVFSLFAAASMSVPMVMRFRRQEPPRNLPELAKRVKERCPYFSIVPVAYTTLDLSQGFYVCASQRSWEDLQRLHSRSPEHLWQGIVLVTPTSPHTTLIIGEDEPALPIGPAVLLGDMEVAQQIGRLFGG